MDIYFVWGIPIETPIADATLYITPYNVQLRKGKAYNKYP